jgi:hypothetical protein
MLKTGKTGAGVAGFGIAGFGLAFIVGFSWTVVGPAEADTASRQSFTAAHAAPAPINVTSFEASTKPPIGKAKFRATSPSSAAVGSDGAPKAGVAAAQAQTVSVAAHAVEPPKTGAAVVPVKQTSPDANRPLAQSKASVAAKPAAANEALLRPVAIAALRSNATLEPAAANAPARAAMLTPVSATTAAKSATRELLRSKAVVNALHKARHEAASHHR